MHGDFYRFASALYAEFVANLNTHDLTRGCLSVKDDPLSDYRDYCHDYDQDVVDYLLDMEYRHHWHLCMVGFSRQRLDECRSKSQKVVEFCSSRWDMSYEEILDSTTLLESLVGMAATVDRNGSEFVVVPFGADISVAMFYQPGEASRATTAPRG